MNLITEQEKMLSKNIKREDTYDVSLHARKKKWQKRDTKSKRKYVFNRVEIETYDCFSILKKYSETSAHFDVDFENLILITMRQSI